MNEDTLIGPFKIKSAIIPAINYNLQMKRANLGYFLNTAKNDKYAPTLTRCKKIIFFADFDDRHVKKRKSFKF